MSQVGGRRPRRGDIGAGVALEAAKGRRADRGRQNAVRRAGRRDSIASSQASNVSAVDRVRQGRQQPRFAPPRSRTTSPGYEPSDTSSNRRSTRGAQSMEPGCGPSTKGHRYGSRGNQLGRQQGESPDRRRCGQPEQQQRTAEAAAEMRASVPRLDAGFRSHPDLAGAVVVPDTEYFNGSRCIERPHWALPEMDIAMLWLFPTEQVKNEDKFYRKTRPQGLDRRAHEGGGAPQLPPHHEQLSSGVKWRVLLQKGDCR